MVVEKLDKDPSSGVSVHVTKVELLKGAVDSGCGVVCVPLEWVPLTDAVLGVPG